MVKKVKRIIKPYSYKRNGKLVKVKRHKRTYKLVPHRKNRAISLLDVGDIRTGAFFRNQGLVSRANAINMDVQVQAIHDEAKSLSKLMFARIAADEREADRKIKEERADDDILLRRDLNITKEEWDNEIHKQRQDKFDRKFDKFKKELDDVSKWAKKGIARTPSAVRRAASRFHKQKKQLHAAEQESQKALHGISTYGEQAVVNQIAKIFPGDQATVLKSPIEVEQRTRDLAEQIVSTEKLPGPGMKVDFLKKKSIFAPKIDFFTLDSPEYRKAVAKADRIFRRDVKIKEAGLAGIRGVKRVGIAAGKAGRVVAKETKLVPSRTTKASIDITRRPVQELVIAGKVLKTDLRLREPHTFKRAREIARATEKFQRERAKRAVRLDELRQQLATEVDDKLKKKLRQRIKRLRTL